MVGLLCPSIAYSGHFWMSLLFHGCHAICQKLSLTLAKKTKQVVELFIEHSATLCAIQFDIPTEGQTIFYNNLALEMFSSMFD